MVNVPETPVYDPGVYQLEVTDPVQGGVSGISNQPSRNLANRTAWLKQRLDALIAGTIIPPTVAPLNGPAFTGSTTAPNVQRGDDSTLIANTNFVQTARGSMVVIPVGGNTAFTLTQDHWGSAILVFTGVLTADINIFFPPKTGAWIVANNTTGQSNGVPWKLTCRTASGGGIAIAQSPSEFNSIWCDSIFIHPQVSPFLLNLTNPMITTALGFTPVQQGGGTFQGGNKVYLGWDSANLHLRLQVDTTDLGQVAMRNDFQIFVGGGGSDAPNNYLYHKSSDGTIIQCYDGASVTGADFIAFPNAFPNKCVQVLAGEGNPSGWVQSNPGIVFSTTFGTQQLSNASFVLYTNRSANGVWALTGGVAYRYIAVGF